jgi:hypothetical protein
LLAIDDDAASWAAARLTARLAGPLKARVTVIHVHFARPGNVLENDPGYRVAQTLVDDVGIELSRTGAGSPSMTKLRRRSWRRLTS